MEISPSVLEAQPGLQDPCGRCLALPKTQNKRSIKILTSGFKYKTKNTKQKTASEYTSLPFAPFL